MSNIDWHIDVKSGRMLIKIHDHPLIEGNAADLNDIGTEGATFSGEFSPASVNWTITFGDTKYQGVIYTSGRGVLLVYGELAKIAMMENLHAIYHSKAVLPFVASEGGSSLVRAL